ncbi:DNA cytosine methyltransferase [Desulforhopalus vacuolatus]|uniref:DNA cytosine methyltransferase n=1 Tax=Desulforhopalus vacuolatus TaxID=40414 RepID=UPI0019652BFD|nr:DNA cytosine methyltransferase [Desulforhopalus vacuolatus]MBM9520602.1 DNA cytosine methyltransferase [Desulforhopalus vacuolatus]
MLNSIEIFSGAGGLAKGLELSGVNHKAFVELNSQACKTLRENYAKELVHESDIEIFNFQDFKNISIIAGGPPCQPFSLGGNHKGNLDKRDMFPYAIKAIQELTPKAFIFENVKGLLRKSFASYFNYIILQLSYPEMTKRPDEKWLDHLKRLEKIHTAGVTNSLRYNVVYRLVNAADYGVPQKRERVIIVGIRNDLNLSWSFPQPTHSEESLLWSQFVTKEYWDRHNIKDMSNSSLTAGILQKTKKLKQKYSLFTPPRKPWRTVRDCIGSLSAPREGESKEYSDHIFRPGAKVYPGHTGSPLDLPSKTIKAGGHGVPGGENMMCFPNGKVRYYTTLEAKLIQTFPLDYKITGVWSEAMRQIGNAVPVMLANIISKSLVKELNS